MNSRHIFSALIALTCLAISQSADAMYHTRLGRFIQRDPGPGGIGAAARVGSAGPIARGGFVQRDPVSQYADGMNLYQYVQSKPVVRRDPLGLTSRADIDAGRLIYSCNCGWIDWAHAKPGIAKFWSKMQNDPAYGGKMKGDKLGFKVHVSMKHGKSIGPIRISDSVGASYWVETGLSMDARKSAALGMFKEIAYEFEYMQASGLYPLFTDSGLSEEDWGSDLLGFYMKVNSVSKDTVKEECSCLTKAESKCVWDESGGIMRRIPPWSDNHWPPRIRGIYNLSPTAQRGCQGAANAWPETFKSIPAAGKGDGWTDW